MKNSNISKRFIGFGLIVVAFLLLFFRAPVAGLNWLIYSCAAAIITLSIAKPDMRLKLVLPAIGLVLSGLAVFVHSDALAITMCLLSFGYLGVSMVIPNVDPGFGALAGFLNFIISPFGVIIRFFQRLNANNGKFRGIVTTLLIPGALLTFFGILYYESSPAFKELLDTFRWDHLPQFIFTMILGIFSASVLLYCFAPERFNKVYDNIGNKSSAVTDYMGNSKFVNSWLIGIWSLVVLLSVVIISDFMYQISGRVPADFTYANYLHQGIYASIFSIVCSAVLTVLTTNYLGDVKKSAFQIANYLFIGLNTLFILQNVQRNFNYISEYGLTEKRLVIYIYLALCVVGLVLTVITIVQNKSLGFLYKTNAFNVYFVLIISALMNWSTSITSYNINHPYGAEQMIDYDYLLSLDKSNTHLLVPHEKYMTDEQKDRLDYRKHSINNYNVDDYREWIYGKTASKQRLNTLNQ